MVVVRSEPHLEDSPLALLGSLVVKSEPLQVIAVLDHKVFEFRLVDRNIRVVKQRIVHPELVQKEVSVDCETDYYRYPLDLCKIEVHHFEHDCDGEVDH